MTTPPPDWSGRVALLLYADVAAAAATTPQEATAELARYTAVAAELTAEGILRGGEAFMPRATGRIVTAAASEPATQPEGRELSGFLLLECDLRRAEQVAASLPVAAHGYVEVRPLLAMPDAGGPSRPAGDTST